MLDIFADDDDRYDGQTTEHCPLSTHHSEKARHTKSSLELSESESLTMAMALQIERYCQ